MNLNESGVRIVEISEANFFLEVVQSKVPVLVGFLAPWSQPLQVLRPVLDEVMTACAGRVKVAWVNADDNPNLSRWYRIKSTPTWIYFVDGRPRARVIGAASKEGHSFPVKIVYPNSMEARRQPMKNSHLVTHPRSEDPGNPLAHATARPLKIRVVFDDDNSARSAEVLIKRVAADLECDARSFDFDDLDSPGSCA